MKSNTFTAYHPIVNFSYFLAVIAFSMLLMNPICLCISLVSSIMYSIHLKGGKQIGFNLKFMLPMMILTALINPAFNHSGMTILTYLPNGNPITLESIVYGIAAAIMLVSVINWFSCFNFIITNDKMVYLFGKIAPSLSLVFSMTLRFVPRFTEQFKKVSYAQKCIRHDFGNGNVRQKIHHALTVVSIMLTWSLENAIETADSMKNRGYGLKGRTAFSIFRWDRRDIMAMLFIAFNATLIICGIILDKLYFQYLPNISGVLDGWSILLYVCYALLMMMPIVIDIWEVKRWKILLNSEM